MKTIKHSISRWVTVRIFSLLLLTLPVSFYGQFTLAKPEKVKSIIAETGAYEKVVPTIVDQSASAMAGQYVDASQLPLNDPEVAKVFKQSISGNDAKKYSESIIDSVYAFAQSDKKQFSSSVDYSESKTKIIDGLAAYAGGKLEGKPNCSLQQTLVLRDSFNIFTTPCIPYGTSVPLLTEQLKAQLAAIDTKNSTTAPLDNTAFGKVLTKNSAFIQNGYTLLSIGFWLNTFALLLAVAALMMLKTNKGLYVSALLQSIFALCFFAGISLLLFSKNPTNALMAQNQLGREVMLPVSYGFAKTLAHIEFSFAAIYGVLAGGIYIYAKRAKATAQAAQQALPTLGGQVRSKNLDQR